MRPAVEQFAARTAAVAAGLKLDQAGGLSPSRFLQAWKALGRLGLLGLPFPAKFGGSGRSLSETAIALESLGRHAGFNCLALSVGAQMWAVQTPLLKFGSPEQKRRFLAPLCRGRARAAPAVTEKEAGSDVLGMKGMAERRGASYLVNAQKSCVTHAPLADFFLVWVRLAGRQGPMSLDCFVVPRNTRGLTTAAFRWEMGPAGAVSGTVSLKDCVLPASARLGRECQGLTVFLYAMAQERRLILAPAVGAMERRLEETAQFARKRQQSGRPIASFQAVAHRLADMKIRLEASRALLRQACLEHEDAFEAGGREPDDGRCAAVKAFLSESWVANCLDAVEIRGAAGCLDAGLRAELGAALSSRLMSGTNDIQKNLIAQRLGHVH
ncbi:MAG: acyl-CoA dehydrogenase family protein [Elusimicrobia bacterium]|nr:acyl-CoA dehydrogenase family protein [Elusimicrobiota bacterium]